MTTQTESNIEKRKIRRCPECKSTHLVERRDERCTVCLGCGFFISDETIKLASEERPSRESSKLFKPIVLFSKKTSSDENSEHDDGRIASTLNQWKNLKTSDSGEKNLAL